jgi:hypothetical protein
MNDSCHDHHVNNLNNILLLIKNMIKFLGSRIRDLK